MKKIFGFLGMALLMSLASCSNDDFLDGTQAGGGTEVGTKGDLYMTMNISMVSSTGTRTQTPNQGYEIGKDRENKVSGALIILAQQKQDGSGYTIKFTSGTGAIPAGNIVGPSNPSGEDENYNGALGNGGDANNSNVPADGDFIEVDSSHSTQYKAAFTFDRQQLINALQTPVDVSDNGHTGKKGEFVIFMVANPTSAILQAAAQPNADLQTVINEMTNKPIGSGLQQAEESLWKDYYFVMSSADAVKKTIYEDEIPVGTHNTKAEAYHLGTVRVQRVMSRFDLATKGNHLTFLGEGNNNDIGKSDLGKIQVQFDAVSMVNMAKSAYLYKVMADAKTTLTSWPTLPPTKFGDERDADYSNWWTFTPNQPNYYNQLFDDFVFDDTTPASSTGLYKGLERFFDSGADFQLVSSLSEEDNTFEHPNHSDGTGDYRIWRYAMENTNPDDPANQVNGNSTGVVFRGILTDTKAETGGYEKVIPTTYKDNNEANAEAIYAYNNVILGTAEQLFQYATSPKAEEDGVYEAVSTIYWSIIQSYYESNKKTQGELGEGVEWDYDNGWKDKAESNEGKAWWIEKKDVTDQQEPQPEEGVTVYQYVYHHPEFTEELRKEIDDKLVPEGFNIYRPKTVTENNIQKPVYYCYYIYWNRHNDNIDNTNMGIMEFATVRNNVYKLSVDAIHRLGHPGLPEDDPNKPTPGTPDENDEFWLDVDCQILPWEVRVNNIEF